MLGKCVRRSFYFYPSKIGSRRKYFPAIPRALLSESVVESLCLNMNEDKDETAHVVWEVDSAGHVLICLKEEDTLSPTQVGVADENEKIEDSVLQYQRQLRKAQAAKRAGEIVAEDQLKILYYDDSVVVVDKPSRVLCVPGINNNPSIADLVYKQHGEMLEDSLSMTVHRLDMDTSGVVLFGKRKEVVSKLHSIFREREQTDKEYEAILCGHIPTCISTGYIDLPLQRDVDHPPFMRVSTPHSEIMTAAVVEALRERGWRKLSKRNPKPSQTEFRVTSREYYANEWPVTRVQLKPVTGRTHQLRVHCAAMGFPILGDPVYGIYGEAYMFGGLPSKRRVEFADKGDSTRCDDFQAPLSLQKTFMEIYPPTEKPMCLHAKRLSLPHPVTGKVMDWIAPVPF